MGSGARGCWRRQGWCSFCESLECGRVCGWTQAVPSPHDIRLPRLSPGHETVPVASDARCWVVMTCCTDNRPNPICRGLPFASHKLHKAIDHGNPVSIVSFQYSWSECGQMPIVQSIAVRRPPHLADLHSPASSDR